MIEIRNAIPIVEFPIRGLMRVSDLIYFEGPLLSHFQTASNDHYLFYWVDANEDYNRWLVVRVTLDRLQSYVKGLMGLLNLISSPEDGYVYKIDIAEDLSYNNCEMVFAPDLPDVYLPEKGSLYKFKPQSTELDLSIYSRRHCTGILQAYFKNSEKTPYNEIDLKLFGSSLYFLSEIREGLSKDYVKQKIKSIRSLDKKADINKDSLKRKTQVNYFASAGGSFSALFKPASNAIPMEGIPSEEDEFILYFMAFFNSSTEFEKLSVFVNKLDAKIITAYKDLLNTIIGAKLNFFLKWENAITHTQAKESIGYQKAQEILNVIEQLEFEDKEDIKLIGKFSALNIKSGKYEFYEIDDDENISKGKMDKERHEMCFQIDFKHTYEVVIKRKVSKEMGSKNPKTLDEMISFVPV